MTTRVHHIAPVCEFGGCDILGTTREDGYLFCSKHLVEHRLEFHPIPRQRVKPAPKDLQPCGTAAAYNRHLRNREKPCEPCAEASRVKNRNRKDRIKTKAEQWDAEKDGAA